MQCKKLQICTVYNVHVISGLFNKLLRLMSKISPGVCFDFSSDSKAFSAPGRKVWPGPGSSAADLHSASGR